MWREGHGSPGSVRGAQWPGGGGRECARGEKRPRTREPATPLSKKTQVDAATETAWMENPCKPGSKVLNWIPDLKASNPRMGFVG